MTAHNHTEPVQGCYRCEISIDETAAGQRIGIELPDVYDGVSVWMEPDGTYTNRGAALADRYPEGSIDRAIIQRRADAAQQWIDRQEALR